MRVGFIGLGRMVSRMAANIRGGGFDLEVWNRTRVTAETFADSNRAAVAETPAALAANVDVVVTMLADDASTETVYGGPDGLLEGLGSGKVAIDMGTVAVSTTRSTAAKVAATGADHIDAPVSGSVAAAEQRTLMIMAAGDGAVIDRVSTVLEAMGSPVLTVGASGAGSALKLAINSMIFTFNQAASEALILAERSGVDRATAYDAFMNSAAGAPVIKYRQQVFVEPGTTPVSFTMDLAIKDMELILGQAAATGTSMPAQQVSLDVMRAAADAGMPDADMGMTAVYLRDNAGKDGAGQ